MNTAIGLVETKGLIALVEATDAMAKAANVEIVKRISHRRRLRHHRRARRRRQRAGGRRSRRAGRHASRRTGRQPRDSPSSRRTGRGLPVVRIHCRIARQRRRCTRRWNRDVARKLFADEGSGRQPGLDELQVPAVRHGRRAPACARRHRTDRLAGEPLRRRDRPAAQRTDRPRARPCGGRAALPGAVDRSRVGLLERRRRSVGHRLQGRARRAVSAACSG